MAVATAATAAAHESQQFPHGKKGSNNRIKGKRVAAEAVFDGDCLNVHYLDREEGGCIFSFNGEEEAMAVRDEHEHQGGKGVKNSDSKVNAGNSQRLSISDVQADGGDFSRSRFHPRNIAPRVLSVPCCTVLAIIFAVSITATSVLLITESLYRSAADTLAKQTSRSLASAHESEISKFIGKPFMASPRLFSTTAARSSALWRPPIG